MYLPRLHFQIPANNVASGIFRLSYHNSRVHNVRRRADRVTRVYGTRHVVTINVLETESVQSRL